MAMTHFHLKGESMKIQAAVVKEQGVTFAVVVVKRHIVDSQQQALTARTSFIRYFPGLPIILMAQDSRGTPTYSGRRDIVQFLVNVPMEALPWKEFTFTEAA